MPAGSPERSSPVPNPPPSSAPAFGIPRLRPAVVFVSQEDLAELFSLQCAVEEAEGQFQELRDRIIQDIKQGARIEDGLRTVRIKEHLEIL